MNCKKITQFIPLFIEADLADAEMQCVTKHLESCDSCSNTVKEFHTSQLLLRSVTLPEFDEDVFAQIRSTMMNELARPKISEFILPVWNWKAAFAASVAMIILLSGIALNRHSSNKNYVAQADNFKDKQAENFASSPSRNFKIVTAKFSDLNRIPKPRSGRNSMAQGEASVSKHNPGYDAAKLLSPEMATDIDEQSVAAAPSEANNQRANNTQVLILPPSSQAENITSNSDKSASEPEMLRMEIQTADPNIKIIWLMPQTNTQSDRK